MPVKIIKFFLISLVFFALIFGKAQAADSLPVPPSKIRVIYFYAHDCPNCQKLKPFVEKIKEKYRDKIDFLEHDVKGQEEDLRLFLQFVKTYNLPDDQAKVPLIFAGRDYLLGVNDIENNLEAKIDEKIYKQENLLFDCHKFLADWEKGIHPETGLTPGGSCSATESKDFCSVGSTALKPALPGKPAINLSIPSVLVVGFLAGFNPCLLAILAFIASVTLATTGKRRNVLLIVLMFSLGIFATYLVIGIGLLNVLEQSAGLQTAIKYILIVLLGFLGIWHVYDAYHLRKNEESTFRTPKAFIRLTENVTKKVSLPAAFAIGSLFSLIKAPCVGAVYLVILDMVRNGQGSGLLYLAAYNLGVVLPVLAIGGAITFGANPEKVEKFRKEKRSALRLVTGLTLLAIAVLMYANKI